MRVLTTDIRDNSLVASETDSIYVVQTVEAYSSYSEECINTWQFISVINFKSDNDDYYVIFNSIEEANSLVYKAFTEGVVDLSAYGDRTFVNPDETDIGAIDALYDSMMIQSYRRVMI